ncbi:MAG: CHAD domain-containing protein [Acidimicrobiales bacterium]
MSEAGAATVREAIGTAMTADLSRLVRNEPVVREGREPEAVHQARVASRRMRSQLKAFGPAIRRAPARELSQGLAWLAGLLGAVRDLDVLRARLGARNPEEHCQEVMRRLAMQRQEAFAALIVAMGSKHYRHVLESLEHAASAPPVRKSCAEQGATEVLVPLARHRWAAVEEAVASLGAAPRDDELHHVRILSKRARYATELVAPFASSGATTLIKRVSKIQKVLGDLNDGARAVAWLEELKVAPWSLPREGDEAGPDPMIGVELLLAAEHADLAIARGNWHKAFDRARDAAAEFCWSGQQPPARAELPIARLQAVPVTT